MLVAVAARLSERMRSSATTYLGACISLSTVIVAIANLAPRQETDLNELFQSNRDFLGIVGCFLYFIGVIRILAFCRDRKHYIRIINSFNDLRRHGCNCLAVDGQYAKLWTDSTVEPWPPDSVTTLTLLSLSLATAVVLIGSLWAFSLPWPAFSLILAICLLAQTITAIAVSK